MMALEREWPYCAAIAGDCLAYETGQQLGRGVYEMLAHFILGAEPGSRLTLQRNQDGFSVQITGSVYRAGRGTVELADLRAMSKKGQR